MKFVFVDPPYLKQSYVRRIGEIPKISELKVFDTPVTDQKQILERIGDAEMVSSDIYVQFDRKLLEQIPNMKAFFVQAVGYNQIDVEFAKQKGIKVYNCAGFNAMAVSEFVFSVIGSLMRKIPAAQEHVRAGGWDYRLFEGSELGGKTIGIIGSGNVSRGVVNIAKGFGMPVVAYTKAPSFQKAQLLGITQFSMLEQVLRMADILVLAVPLTAETKGMIGKKELKLMKKSAIIVNTSRHTVVDEVALAEALIEEQIAGAALDVILEEPFYSKKQSMLIQEMVNLPNVIVTPHIAGVTKESSEHMGKIFLKNIHNYLGGSDENVVNI